MSYDWAEGSCIDGVEASSLAATNLPARDGKSVMVYEVKICRWNVASVERLNAQK